MQKDKIATLVGFAVKAGKVIYGIDNLELLRKKRYLYLRDVSLGDTAAKRLERLSAQTGTPVLIVKNSLEDITFKPNCKVIGLTDKQMSEACLKNLNENYDLKDAEVKN